MLDRDEQAATALAQECAGNEERAERGFGDARRGGCGLAQEGGVDQGVVVEVDVVVVVQVAVAVPGAAFEEAAVEAGVVVGGDRAVPVGIAVEGVEGDDGAGGDWVAAEEVGDDGLGGLVEVAHGGEAANAAGRSSHTALRVD